MYAVFTVTRRIQAHVGIQPESLTGEEGLLFSHDVVETLDRVAEWAIGAEVVLPAGDAPVIATLGSDARIALLEALPPEAFHPATQVLEAFRNKILGLRSARGNARRTRA